MRIEIARHCLRMIIKTTRLEKKGLYLFSFLICLCLSIACKDRSQPEPEPFPTPTPAVSSYPYYLKPFYSEPASNPSTVEGIALGKALFFDPRLSLDSSVSCASCHKPEKAFSDGLVRSVGIGGTINRRNAPGLYNIGLSRKFFWDGRDTSLEQQSLHPIQDANEMGLNLADAVNRLQNAKNYHTLFGNAFGTHTISPDLIARALAQYMRSLVSTRTKYDSFLVGLYVPTELEMKGLNLFKTHPDPLAGTKGIRGGNCGDCHLQQTLLGKLDGYEGFNNNGLETEFSGSQDEGLKRVTGKPEDLGKFKIPSLRNVALTAPYMHDGRFATLEQVLDHYNHEDLKYRPNVDPLIKVASNERFGESLLLAPDEKTAIIAFLHMLTDHSATQIK